MLLCPQTLGRGAEYFVAIDELNTEIASMKKVAAKMANIELLVQENKYRRQNLPCRSCGRRASDTARAFQSHLDHLRTVRHGGARRPLNAPEAQTRFPLSHQIWCQGLVEKKRDLPCSCGVSVADHWQMTWILQGPTPTEQDFADPAAITILYHRYLIHLSSNRDSER
jgi:hypothetical protein